MPAEDVNALTQRAKALQERYSASGGDPALLNELISVLRAAHRSAPPSRAAQSVAVRNLASALLVRFEKGGHRANLDECLAVLRQAMTSGAGGTLEEACMLATAYQYRHRLDGNPADLDAVINICRFGLDSLPRDPLRWRADHLLGMALRQRFRERGEIADLDAAIEAHRAAAEGNVQQRAELLLNLVESQRTRYELAADPSTLDAAILAAEESIRTVGEDSVVRDELLRQAGILYRYRYEHAGAQSDIMRSVRLLREALKRQGGPALWWQSLASSLQRLFARTGDTEALDEAISIQRRVVDATPQGDPDRATTLNNLALALRYRYSHVGDLAALREAAELLREAGDDRIHMDNLGVTLQDLFRRTGEPGYADEATAVAGEVLARTPASQRHNALHTHATALLCRYAAHARAEDLHEAIRSLEEVLRHSEFGTQRHSMCLGNLGNAWMREYERSGDPTALGRSIEAFGRAVRADAVPEQARALYQGEWGDALLIQFDLLGDPGVLRRATATFAEAAANTGAGPMTRLLSAAGWGRLAGRQSDWQAALAASRMAIELIPYVTGRALARADREHSLKRLSGVAADAAACALRAGDRELALRWLEQGRGVLMRQLLEARADLSAMPEIAREWAEVHEALDVRDLPSDRRHALVARRDALLATIRSRPGFARFLEPPTLDELRDGAVGLPVVLVNVSEHRCDALVLTEDRVMVVPLDRLTPANAQRQAERFATALMAARTPGPGEVAAQETITEILGWLWNTVTGPVLAELGSPPRVWWSPGGALTALPLHAAGHAGGPHVMDRTVSSYTPIVRGARRVPSRSAPRPPTLLVVAMPETDGERPLPGAGREAAAVSALWPQATQLIAAQATRDVVLGALSDHDCVHFACHAISDAVRPSASRLLVHDHRERPLTLLDISREDLPTARLAVLSACHTAHGARELADEALHITAAFQLAGYRSVVGTLWQVNDRVARQVAVGFHQRLQGDPDRAAVALHEAVREIRGRFQATPSLWAAYVHYGR